MGTTGHILVVEDAPAIAEVLHGYLGMCGFSVDCVSDGSEALKRIRSQRPDLVITDVVMPEVSGTELTRRLRATPELHRLPVVLFTGLAADDPDIAATLELPLVRVVQKGKPFAQVREAIEQLLVEAARASVHASLP